MKFYLYSRVLIMTLVKIIFCKMKKEKKDINLLSEKIWQGGLFFHLLVYVLH